MSVLENMKGKEVSPKVAAACILGLVVVSVIGISLVKRAVSGPAPAVDSPKVAKLSAGSAESAKSSGPVKNGEKGAPAEDACAVIIARNIFRPIGVLPSAAGNSSAQPAKPAAAVTALPPMPVGMMQPLPGMGSFGFRMGRGGGRNIAFTGIVDTPDGTMALIENPATSETRFVAVGDKVFGMDVLEVGAHSVLLESQDGQTVRLAMGENKPDAAPKAAAPAAAAAGQQPSGQAQTGDQQAPAAGDAQQNSSRTRRFNRWGGTPGQAAPAAPAQ